MNKKLMLIIGLVVLVVAVPLINARLRGTSAVEVEVEKVEPRVIESSVLASGKLVPALKGTPMNPRPNLTGGTIGCVAPQNPGVDRSATYRGAFVRSAPTLWTTDWTAMNIGGLLAD